MFIIAFLNLFLKILGLQGKVPNTSGGSWFQVSMVLFTKENFLISVLCFPSLIFQTWSTLLKYYGLHNLSCVAFQAHSPEYALKSAYMRAIILCWAKFSQSESSVWLVNWAAFSCTQSNAFISLSVHGSQHADPYPRIGRTSDVWLNFLYSCFLFWEHALRSEVPSRLFVLCNLLGPPSLNHFVRLFPGIYDCLLPEIFWLPR